MSAKYNNFSFNFGGDIEQRAKENVLKKLKITFLALNLDH
jgi:hypothetical protein